MPSAQASDGGASGDAAATRSVVASGRAGATIAQIGAPVAERLDQVETFLSAVWEETPNPALSQLVRHILASGGKKLRPLLTLLCASAHEPADFRAVQVAAAIEILHAATLIHDDVIDHAYVRRGLPTANARWSNALAVLSGDYLFAKCSHVVAELGDPALVRILARTVMRMVASETTQFSSLERIDVVQDEYYRKVRGKTASLLELCCEAGGLVGGASSEQRDALRRYGENVGIAFQIVDDILDIAGTEEELGKPVGGDLREGTITLPIIIFLRQQPAHAAVNRLFGRGADGELVEDGGLGEDDEDALWEAVEAIRQSQALEDAYAQARRFGERARAALAALPPGESRDSLDKLIDYVVERRQ